MKARDIIKGWPKPKSTLPAHDGRDMLRMFRYRHWSPRDRAMLDDEVDSDLRYHERQARMLHEYVTQTGEFEPIERMHGFKLVGFQR